jgi:tRNA nucleotidyltransferase/poly(A) polymerase
MRWREELTRRFPALAKVGDDAYVVGGAIRDLLSGREPADADVACNDPLAAARLIRDRVIRLGDAEHLSAYRIVENGHVYDFAELLDHDIDVDLARRDFTMNAMAVHLGTGKLLDPHGGQRDLAARVVRMVDASNFDDDPLRALKGVRMAVKFGFAIEEQTLAAVRERAERIVEIAAERVTYELSVIFSAGKLREAVDLLQRTGLFGPLGLHARELHADDVSLAGAYALLVEDPRAYTERWRWSVELLREVVALQQLVEKHDRITLYDAGEKIARQLPGVLRALGREDRLDFPDFTIRALLSGAEIAQLSGVSPGQELGRIKRALLEAQIRGEVGTREEAEVFVSRRGAPPPPLSSRA